MLIDGDVRLICMNPNRMMQSMMVISIVRKMSDNGKMSFVIHVDAEYDVVTVDDHDLCNVH